ncbi:MAG: Translation initiation factor 3 subunit J component [Chrysothrix sp. TS-e1954]|nr:MAG: Translation initiation factor 3 subunit J component [Chrysothrix sp. TS-e1954]
MAPPKASKWDDEDEDSTPPSSPPPVVARRGKFDDEEEDSDVLESWDAAEDSEVEREKAKAASEAKAAAEALAKANKKSKAQRIEEHRMESMRRRAAAEEESSEESEDEGEKRDRLRRMEKDADLKNAEDLFGGIGISNNRSANKAVTVADPKDDGKTIDLAALRLFSPTSLTEFNKLRETLAPLLLANSKKAQYVSFTQELTKQQVRDMTSDQVKKIASSLTTICNEKMKEEKLAEKGGKKSKAQKTKTTLNASRNAAMSADTKAYDDDGLDDGDFM